MRRPLRFIAPVVPSARSFIIYSLPLMGSLRSMVLAPGFSGLGDADRTVSQAGDACGVKFRRCPRAAFPVVLILADWCAVELYETALLDLSCLQACSHLIC